jgi:TetR/AcrR family transcriptional regulator, transcriptional repressor for nem operon
MSKGDDTRQRIVAEAAAIFNQRGFEGSSMSALMEATGLEKGGIYRHFSSKEEIAAEAFDYALDLATEARIHDLDTFSNSVDKLKLFIANFVERRSSVPGGCPILNTAVDADDGNPVLRDRARNAFRQWLGRLESIVKSGIKAREIRRGVDPRKVATLVVSSLEGALMISRLERDREALLSMRSFLEAYLERDVRRS